MTFGPCQSRVNKMTPQNLAIVFAPNLFNSELVKDPMQVRSTLPDGVWIFISSAVNDTRITLLISCAICCLGETQALQFSQKICTFVAKAISHRAQERGILL